MATEKEANRAREKHSDYLTSLGAHAILVDKIKAKRGGDKAKGESDEDFCVIAFVEQKPSEPVPKELEIESGGKKKKIPLALKITPMATLE